MTEEDKARIALCLADVRATLTRYVNGNERVASGLLFGFAVKFALQQKLPIQTMVDELLNLWAVLVEGGEP